jgi:hypothetical protein
MKRALVCVMMALNFACLARAADEASGIEFSGVLGRGDDVRLALTNKSTGNVQWVAIGSSFAGYGVSAYDPKADVVVLTKDGRTFRLGLKQRKATSAIPHTPELERGILNNLRQLAAAADQYYLENGKSSTTYDELVGPTKYVKSITPLNGENYRGIQFAQGKAITVITATGHSVSYNP